MKLKHYIILLCCSLSIYTECRRNNFFPDPDNPGLSRFTSRGYGVASNYINGKSFINTASNFPLLQKDSTGNSIDTLTFKWSIFPNDYGINNTSIYQNIAFLIAVPQSFNKNDLLGFNGQRFLNSHVAVQIQRDSLLTTISGLSNLYFVSITEDLSNPLGRNIKLSGLFNGNIGDSVSITNGRFDFEIPENQLNF